MFHGSICALITPFDKGKVDENSYENFVNWQIEQGTDGLVPCGTTGESPTLSHSEHKRVVEMCISVSNGRVPVIAGTGSNSTDEAVMLTEHAKKAGADADAEKKVKAAGQLKTQGKNYEVQSGDVILIPDGDFHKVWNTGFYNEDDLEFICVFDGKRNH